jgi:hypothetical protein
LVNGTEIVFRKPDEDSEGDDDEDDDKRAVPSVPAPQAAHEEVSALDAATTAEESRVVIHEDE